MILHTCSWRAYRPGLGQPVRTSLGKPRWLLPEAAAFPVCWEITPRGHFFNAPAEAFEDAFIDQLERYGTRRIARRLAAISRETGAETLLLACFEPLPSQCHRGLMARWWFESTGEVITEMEGT